MDDSKSVRPTRGNGRARRSHHITSVDEDVRGGRGQAGFRHRVLLNQKLKSMVAEQFKIGRCTDSDGTCQEQSPRTRTRCRPVAPAMLNPLLLEQPRARAPTASRRLPRKSRRPGAPARSGKTPPMRTRSRPVETQSATNQPAETWAARNSRRVPLPPRRPKKRSPEGLVPKG